MGWLWNVDLPGIPSFRRGWKPGAVARPIAKIMSFHMKSPKMKEMKVDEVKIPKTLRVERKTGNYTVTMHPHDPNHKGENLNPIVFKLFKVPTERIEARRALQMRGIVKACDCKTIESCKCISNLAKKNLICEMKKISREMSLHPELQFHELNETSESEMSFEFSPPTRMKKLVNDAKLSNDYTQYEDQGLCGDGKSRVLILPDDIKEVKKKSLTKVAKSAGKIKLKK
jgi:hypothetical protein